MAFLGIGKKVTDNQRRCWNTDYTVQLYLSELYLEPINLRSILQMFRCSRTQTAEGPRTRCKLKLCTDLSDKRDNATRSLLCARIASDNLSWDECIDCLLQVQNYKNFRLLSPKFGLSNEEHQALLSFKPLVVGEDDCMQTSHACSKTLTNRAFVPSSRGRFTSSPWLGIMHDDRPRKSCDLTLYSSKDRAGFEHSSIGCGTGHSACDSLVEVYPVFGSSTSRTHLGEIAIRLRLS
jgi:hypothetical protein